MIRLVNLQPTCPGIRNASRKKEDPFPGHRTPMGRLDVSSTLEKITERGQIRQY